MADAQPALGGGGDTKTKVRRLKSEAEMQHSNLLLKHPDAALATYV
jgi:hypothetical protein